MSSEVSRTSLAMRIVIGVVAGVVVVLFLRARVNPQESICLYEQVRVMLPEVCGGFVE